MKKILSWTVVVSVILFAVIFGLYYVGPYTQKQDILFSMADLNTPQHKGLASTCFKKKFTQYMCCLESVETMHAAHVMPVTDSECGAGMQRTSLDCEGSFDWCMPTGQIL